MKAPTVSRWRSEAAKQRFHALEQAIWDDSGYPEPDPLDIPTWAGTTRVYRWHGDAEPIVLLHGMGGTGLTWGPYLEGLAGHDVYAVDTIGDVGRGEQTALIADADDLARWLDETLANAGIERAHLVGTSYGGYLALNLAVRAPQRIASITLIDSGGLSPFRLGRFMLWGLPNLLGSRAPAPIRRAMARTRPLLEEPRLMRGALLGQTNHPFGMPQLVPLSDDELRAITVPTTAVIAGRSAPFEPRLAARRAALIPTATIDVIAGAKHEVMWTHADRCVNHVIPNCEGTHGAPNRHASETPSARPTPRRRLLAARSRWTSMCARAGPVTRVCVWLLQASLVMTVIGGGGCARSSTRSSPGAQRGGARSSIAEPATPTSTSTSASAPLPSPTDETVTLGMSVRGRRVTADHRAGANARYRMVVVGCIHGNEAAGIAVARALETLTVPAEIDLWVIDDINPDGVAAGTRQNADGVDLNRNFPYRWQPIGRRGDQQYSGTGPLSEPESRAAASLITRVRPDVTIWFHQPVGVVDESGGDIRIERKYAQLVGMPLRRLTRYPGSAAGWQNATLPPTTAFVVELPRGPLSPANAASDAKAIFALPE